jgi:DUF1680 family protein
MRLVASLGHYVATRDGSGLQVHQYVAGRIATALAPGRAVALRVETAYPWDGAVRFRLEASDGRPWALALRVPAWCAGAAVRVAGRAAAATPDASGYLRLERAWAPGDVVELDLPMAPRLVEPHPWIEGARGCVAIECGPLVYCLEQADHPGTALADLEIDAAAPLAAAWDGDRLEGVTVVRAAGCQVDTAGWTDRLYRPVGSAPPPPRRAAALTAVPYYAWANRGPGAMRVWIPRRG